MLSNTWRKQHEKVRNKGSLSDCWNEFVWVAIIGSGGAED
ncbi:hypothetical protein BN1221_00302c [Brenneria goodwinii]|uniref:Uncharacterized protein n=1 Tax=Brenneria goodwinii TaxID=1109412 RepID=A0A0G4JPT0_9GAMM|nr:hypothetical protein BN1221_00302c [Brenneria goodwinii]